MRSSFAVPLAAVGLLLAAIAADAQAPMRVYRIGFVGTNRPVAPDLRQALRDAGYVESRNLVIEARFAEGRHDRLTELVANVLRAKVDVLVCISPAAELDRALAAIGAGRAQAMVVARSLLFTAHTAKIVQFAANRRVPARRRHPEGREAR